MKYAKAPFDDVLDALMLEEPEPNYEALSRWSARYPEHRDALATFFATWAAQAERPQETLVDQVRLANLSVSHALDILHRRDDSAKRSMKADGKTARLIATARRAGLTPEELARRSQLDVSIVEKLDLRRITGGIPQLCLEWLAAALGMMRTEIEEMSTGAPLMSAGAHYKASSKPTPTTEAFAEAVRASALPDETKRFWLDTMADEEASKTN
jgi:hypothetical protein